MTDHRGCEDKPCMDCEQEWGREMTMIERNRWTWQRLELHPPGQPLRERLRRDVLLMAQAEAAGWYASLTVFGRQYTLMRRSKA